MRFLREIMRVPKGTSKICIVAESDRPMPSHTIILLTTRYWDRLATLSSSRLLFDAAKENFDWVCKGAPNDTNWWGCCVVKLAVKLGANIHIPNIIANPPLLEQPHIMSATHDFITHVLGKSISDGMRDHRDLYRNSLYAQARGERMRTYAQYFWLNGDPSSIKNVYLHRKMVAFRLGNHGLGVLHRTSPTIRRAEMACKHCNMDIIEDETHFLLECPLYSNLRSQFHTIFSTMNIAGPLQPLCLRLQGDNTLREFLGTKDQSKLAAFISACLALRKSRE